ncbi:ATP-dependent helicase [Pseudoalteromonas sp. JBTF-M23]|uniref:DNA 3'-5' helicase II n=1 Tax=Pseudoalteromonas caenipelagi TaxID=2726988 RepID=A0A849VCA3_9GAMM|nr:UvrD-helicase domain-containing protein [Pseudoalteromonas caenipelagi]NOU50916.1 ATP-dependent helicase [Pseudoalteromonas caenipelagi]
MSTPQRRTIEPTEADLNIRSCIDEFESFTVIAGAGSGKTTSLVLTLGYVREKYGSALRREGQQIACITFTNRGVGVISERLGWDDLYEISTLHSFLWSQIKRFSTDIRNCLADVIIPTELKKQREKDTGKDTKSARDARAKVEKYEDILAKIDSVDEFKYDSLSSFSNYLKGELSHDDVISISGHLISNNRLLQKVIGQRYPYMFIDEAQDTFGEIVEALNTVCSSKGLPLIGYFGDPMQQIYDRGMGNFAGPKGSFVIRKRENYRCCPEVINLLNRYRKDIEQIPSGENAKVKGSVRLSLVQAEKPEAPRNKYSDEQLDRVAIKYDKVIKDIGWHDRKDVKHLFLVRQMIARRLGFENLHRLFTGEFSSTYSQDTYESGEHYLLRPFTQIIIPLIEAHTARNTTQALSILKQNSPAFDPDGKNSSKSIKKMIELAKTSMETLYELWEGKTLKEVLKFALDNKLIGLSERLLEDIEREPINIEFSKEVHQSEKGKWLAESFFSMNTSELPNYYHFINDNTPFSTQHGVKGEEYPNVVAVFDDIEAAWNQYSFTKTLSPQVYGQGTDGQLSRTSKLAYVCFSRAEVNLNVILFTRSPELTKQEVVNSGLFLEDQISVVQ